MQLKYGMGLAVWALFSLVQSNPTPDYTSDHLSFTGNGVLRFRTYEVKRLRVGLGGNLTLVNPAFVNFRDEFINTGTFCELHESGSQSTNTGEIAASRFLALSMFKNTGLFVYDSLKPPKFREVRLGPMAHFHNSGVLWFRLCGARQPDAVGSLTQPSGPLDCLLVASDYFKNDGEIIFRGLGNGGLVGCIKSTPENDNGITNNGLLTLRNAIMTVDSQVEGWGCIAIEGDSTLSLKVPNKFSREQTIFMKTSLTGSVLDLVVGNGLPTFNLLVMGFNKNSIIDFSLSMQMSTESRDSKFHFGFGGDAFPATISLYPYRKEDINFDGRTLTVKANKSRLPPQICRSKALAVENKVYEMRAAVLKR